MVYKTHQDGTLEELPTFEEAYAYVDYNSASENDKNLILKARYNIVFGETSWTVDDAVKIIDNKGNIHTVPEFKDLFPGWDLKEISKLHENNTTDTVNTKSANFAANVNLSSGSNTFYRFNSNGNRVSLVASTLPGSTYNAGFTNEDNASDVG